MSTCQHFQEEIHDVLADEALISEALMEHTATCKACHDLLALHHEFSLLDAADHRPDTPTFNQVRRQVLRNIRQQGRVHGQAQQPTPLVTKRRFPVEWVLPLTVAASLILGFYLGQRQSGKDIEITPFSQAKAGGLRTISNLAQQSDALRNLQIFDSGNGKVLVHAEMAYPLTLEADQNDPLLQNLLAQSLMQPGRLPVSSRLQAIETTRHLELRDEVKDALIQAMSEDPEVSVRLRAMEILKPYKNDRDVQTSFQAVLQNEESVQMRLLAIECLAQAIEGETEFSQILSEVSERGDVPVLIRGRNSRR